MWNTAINRALIQEMKLFRNFSQKQFKSID